MRKTKIIATIGPASDSPELIDKLITSGVNIFRFNMKHADIAYHDDRIIRVREAMRRVHMPIGVLIDLQGPEIRLETPGKAEIAIEKGEAITFSLEPDSEGHNIILPTPEVFDAVKPGNRLLIDDGLMEFDIIDVSPTSFNCIALQACTVKHRKSVNFPMVDIKLPSLTENDYEKLDMKQMKEVDFIALSFTRNREDVDILRREMDKREIKAKIVAKIENQIALNNLDEIIEASDAIMVARGDLAVEIPLEQLIYWQKQMIERCRKMGKPVIAATQMLHSMVKNARPTRAEISDVSNAVYDGTDCVMLSEETAGGQFPVQTVQTMDRIVSFIESVAVPPFIEPATENHNADVARGTYELLKIKHEPKIAAAIIFAKNLDYLRHVCAYRLSTPIIALSDDSTIRRTLRMSYGVFAPKLRLEEITRENIREILDSLKTKGYVATGDMVYVIDETMSEDRSEESTYFSYMKV